MDAAAVVRYGADVVFLQHYLDVVAARQYPSMELSTTSDQVMQAAHAGGADVHGGRFLTASSPPSPGS